MGISHRLIVQTSADDLNARLLYAVTWIEWCDNLCRGDDLDTRSLRALKTVFVSTLYLCTAEIR